jgi:hypothetical protein
MLSILRLLQICPLPPNDFADWEHRAHGWNARATIVLSPSSTDS